MLSKVDQVQKDKSHMFFFHIWKIAPNTNTSIISLSYIHIESENMFPIVGLLEETWGGGKEEENDRQ
jgi:hypothetical protein